MKRVLQHVKSNHLKAYISFIGCFYGVAKATDGYGLSRLFKEGNLRHCQNNLQQKELDSLNRTSPLERAGARRDFRDPKLRFGSLKSPSWFCLTFRFTPLQNV